MADNTAIKNAADQTVQAATDELTDGSQSPKVSLLPGTGSPTPISPATAGGQDTGNASLVSILAKLVGTPSISSATIANAQSLSSGVDLGAGRLVRIQMPPAWTDANLTFQTSTDGGTYADLYDAAGSEYTIPAGAGRSILIPRDDFVGTKYLKVRSGSAGTPVSQGASRDLTLVLI